MTAGGRDPTCSCRFAGTGPGGSRQARVVGRPVPGPRDLAAEAFSRAADAFYGLLCALGEGDWRLPVLRGLDVQGLVGHLIGVEDDVRRCLAGDPEVAGASHVESTQPAAERQAGRRGPDAPTGDPPPTAPWTLYAPGDPGAKVAVHGMRLPLSACWWYGRSSCGHTTTTSARRPGCQRRYRTRRRSP